MHINNVLKRYDEEIIPISTELYFLEDYIYEENNYTTWIEPFKTELYGTKNKKCIINLVNKLSDEDINISGIELPIDHVCKAFQRIELEIGGQVVYWVDEYALIMLLTLLDEDEQQIDILKHFISLLPLSFLKKSDVDLIFTYKDEFINSDACQKEEEIHKVFKYHNYDVDYDHDFGYDERAFNYITTYKYNVFTPKLTIKYIPTRTVMLDCMIPIIQLYRIFDGEDHGKIKIKNTLIFGIATQLLFVTYPDSIDLTTVSFKIIMEKGTIDNVFLQRHKHMKHIYTLDMPERKSKIRDEYITMTYHGRCSIIEIYAVFTNAISINNEMGHLTYFVHH